MQEYDLEEINDKIANLLDVIDEFIDLVDAENNALQAYNVEVVGSLYEKKTKIVAAYRSMSAFFIKNQKYLAEADVELKQELKEASKPEWKPAKML